MYIVAFNTQGVPTCNAVVGLCTVFGYRNMKQWVFSSVLQLLAVF